MKGLSVLEQSILLEALFDYAEEADEDNEAVANTLYQRFKDQFNAEDGECFWDGHDRHPGESCSPYTCGGCDPCTCPPGQGHNAPPTVQECGAP